MAHSTELFDLIRSLDKAEKRYFKLYAGMQSGEKQYLKVFDQICKMDTYDEPALLEHFKGEAFTNKFHVLKNYLYNLVLRSLRTKEDGGLENKIQNNLADADHLKQKGLYDQEKKVLERTLKLAEMYDLKSYQINILDSLRNNCFQFTQKKLQQNILELSQKLCKVTESLNNEIKLSHIYDQIFLRSREHRVVRNVKEADLLDKLVAPLNLTEDVAQLTFRELHRYHGIYAIYFRLKQDTVASRAHLRLLVANWEDNPHMIKLQPNEYKLTVSNYLSSCFNTGSFSDFEEHLEKIEKIPCRTFNEEAEQFQNLSLYRLLFHANSGQLARAIALIPEIEKGMVIYSNKVNEARKLALYHTMVSIYFVSGNTELALDVCYKILNNSNVDHRKDIQHFAKIMQLLIHFELNNLQLLSNLLSTTYRSLKKHDVLYEYESLILKYLRKIPFVPDKKERQSLFGHFSNDLQQYTQKHPEKRPLGIKELNIWIDAKVQDIPLKERYLQDLSTAEG